MIHLRGGRRYNYCYNIANEGECCRTMSTERASERIRTALASGEPPRMTHGLVVEGGRVALPGCDDLVLDLDELWAELDRLGPAAGA